MALEAQKRPIIGVTMGDAAGIGPEIVIKALSDKTLNAAFRSVVIGDAVFLRKIIGDLALDLELVEFAPGKASPTETIEVFDLANLPLSFEIGTDAAVTGRASAEYIKSAVTLCLDGKIDAISTAPISKKAIGLGGYDFPGHTEFLAELTGTSEFAMSFFADDLRVVLLSTHMSLLDAIALIKTKKIIDLIAFTDKTLGRLLGRKITIAVAGLNPHASEHGMFGAEERDEIEPAVAHCRHELGIDVTGPYSPDTIFLRGHKGEFDVCIALYHDQATIAVKSLSFGEGVNVTLGLPLIRTSVDHGTAYDISGKYVADPSSMLTAIKLAGSLVKSSRSIN